MDPHVTDEPKVVAAEEFDRLLANSGGLDEGREFIVAARFAHGVFLRAGPRGASTFDLHEAILRSKAVPVLVDTLSGAIGFDMVAAMASHLADQLAPLARAGTKPLRVFLGASIEAAVGKPAFESAYFTGAAVALQNLQLLQMDTSAAPPAPATSAQNLLDTLGMNFALWLRPYVLPLVQSLPDAQLPIMQTHLSVLLPLLTMGFDADETAVAGQIELLLLLAELPADLPYALLETALALRTTERICRIAQLSERERKQVVSETLLVAAVRTMSRWLCDRREVLDYGTQQQYGNEALLSTRHNLVELAHLCSERMAATSATTSGLELAISDALLQCAERIGQTGAKALHSLPPIDSKRGSQCRQ